MKRLFLPLFSVLVLAACNNNAEGDHAEGDTTDTALADPSRVHPPEEAITDSTKLVNDSVIVPDTAPRSGAPGDTTRR